MPAKCTAAWGIAQPPPSPELESHCAALTNAMRPVRPNWRWMVYQTLAGGQSTTHSMHARLLKSCALGCPAAPDSVPPFLTRSVLLYLLCSPASPNLHGTLTSWGDGPDAAYPSEPANEISTSRSNQRIELSFHCSHKMKHASPTPASIAE
eukprot:4197829-Pyramimonas_sp.AAC.1